MKIMRISRFMMIGLLATSLLASCKKEDNTGNTNPNLNLDGISFKASTEKGNPNARTYLAYDKIKWMSGDQILVQNSANQQAAFEVVEGLDSQDGVFYTGSTSFDRSPNYAAAYPYDKASISGTTATFTIPGTQVRNEEKPNSFGNGTMPMVAYSSNNVLNFKNVFGGICFAMKGSGQEINKIVLTSKNTADKLWGRFAADCTSNDPIPAYVTGSGGSNSIELTCNATLTAEEQEFIIMVPPATLGSGFTMTAYKDDAKVVELVSPSDFNPGSGFMERSHIKKLEQVLEPISAYIVTAVASPTDGGAVSGGGTYASGASCTVTATPNAGYAFAYWKEGTTIVSNYRTYTFNVTGNRNLTACFVPTPTGGLRGLYSVSASQKVFFSMGNLQYNNEGSTWRFATNQWDRIGNNGQYTSESTGARDVFAWAMNGIDHRGGYGFYMPYHLGLYAGGYYPNACLPYQNPSYGQTNTTYNLDSRNPATADWGYNAISNGGNTVNYGWRTLTVYEWSYLLNRNSTLCPKGSWRQVTYRGVFGVLLLPDYYDGDVIGNLSTLTDAQWSMLQQWGAAFLPAAGERSFQYNGAYWGNNDFSVSGMNLRNSYPIMDSYETMGHYWSATHNTSDDWYNASIMTFTNINGQVGTGETMRLHGCCVRLSKNAVLP